MSKSTGNRKVRRGRVASNKMDKTIVVETDRIRQHPLYGKYLRRNSRLKVHDEHEVANEGDLVEIEETRPLSKTKRWRLLRVLETAEQVTEITPESTGSQLEADSP